MSKEKPVRITVISAKEDIGRRIQNLMDQGNAIVAWENRIAPLLEETGNGYGDVVLLSSNVWMDQQEDCERFLKSASRISPTTQVLILTEQEHLEESISALKKGAYQYAKFPISDDELKALIETAIEDRPIAAASLQVPVTHREKLDTMIGASQVMQQVYDRILKAAAVDIPILLLGETGTGKDLAGQIIHRRSQRRERPFVSVNLGSFPSEMVASELFGHEKGSFSGAVRQHQGVFERAHDGSVFLDEIDTIDEKVRVSLLRLLENKKFTRLGGAEELFSDARLIAASNADLAGLVEEGKFREDLFYRLDVFRIEIPPLRRRPEDIPQLVDAFIRQFNGSLNSKVRSVSQDVLERLQGYDWPGNVRELKNVIQRSMLVCEDSQLELEHLPPRLRETEPDKLKVAFEIGTSLDEVEKVMVQRALAATNNNRKEAAKLLGISRRVIYNKLKKHGLK
jgi:DNA-binding NtrC family response regulator